MTPGSFFAAPSRLPVSPYSVRNTATGAFLVVRRTVVMCAVFALAACSSPATPIEAPLEIRTAQPETVETIVTASVLIVAQPEASVPRIEYAEISPALVVLDAGDTVQLSAKAFAEGGTPLEDVEFVWAMADLRAGAVTKDGLFQAGTSPGVFEDSVNVTGIQNTPDGIKFAGALGSVTVVGEADSPTLATVAIIPESPTLLRHQIYRMRAFGFDKAGRLIPGVRLVWKLNAPALGRLNEIGYLTVEADEGVFEGAVTVTVIWDGARVSAETDIRVISAPDPDAFLTVRALPQRFFVDPKDRMTLTAVALNGLGELVAGTDLRWTIVDDRAGTIAGDGDFIAGASPGVYTDAVRVEAVVPGERGFVRAEDFVSIVIRQPTAATELRALAVQPHAAVVAPGGRATIVVRAVDESGDPAENVEIAWQLASEEIGEITSDGGFTAGNRPGIYPQGIRVVVEQHLGEKDITLDKSVNVTITGTLSHAEVQPVLATITTGRTVHFSLRGWDENQVELPGLVVRWRVSDDTIGTIDAFGNFTAGDSPGFYEDAVSAEVVQILPGQQ